MNHRRNDKFMQEMRGIHQARQHRRARREQERLIDEHKPAWREKQEDLGDSWEFHRQGLGALGREVAKEATREAGNIVAEIFREGVDLTVDALTSLVTLGLAPQPSPMNGKHRRRRR